MCNLSQELLDISQKMDVIYDVSDYTHGLPQLEPRLEKFQETLSQHQIRYVRKKMDFWLDFGFDTADHSGESEEQKIAFFHRCGAPFRGKGQEILFLSSGGKCNRIRRMGRTGRGYIPVGTL